MASDRIVIDPKVMGGAPCIRGTRIPVVTIVAMLDEGMAADEIIRDFDQLTKADVSAAVAFALRTKSRGFTKPRDRARRPHL
jgi:uncharacterized protein (DUF433 family)